MAGVSLHSNTCPAKGPSLRACFYMFYPTARSYKLTVENGRLSAWNRIISAHFHLPITPSGLVFWQGSVDAQRQRCHESRVQWQPHRVGLSKTRRFTNKRRFTLLRERAKSNVKTEEMFKKARFHRRFSYKTTPPYAPWSTRLRTLAKLSPMIEKTLL